jgi:hypothetical protein
VRPCTTIYPAVDALESRQLLSSLPVLGTTAEIRVERDRAIGPLGNGDGGPSMGTLGGTGTTTFHFGYPIGSSQTFEFLSGTGHVKHLGRVNVVVSGPSASRLDALAGGLPGGPVPLNLEGSPQGTISLVNARGRRVGEIDVEGGSWRQFTFLVRNAGHGVVGRGTGSLIVPVVDPIPGSQPTFPPEPTTLNGPTIPYTILL